MPCSICGQSGHNKKTCKQIITNEIPVIENHSDTDELSLDNYTVEILREMYLLHKNYVISRKQLALRLGIKFRLPSIPEDISENIIKFIIHKCGDKSCSWDCKGDLISRSEGIQECKCFTSIGPISFTPSSDWDVIYFLDARDWLNDRFILYKVKLKRTSEMWKSIIINKTQTFNDQCNQKRRPRIGWIQLYPQIKSYCEQIYSGTFDDIFTETKLESNDQRLI